MTVAERLTILLARQVALQRELGRVGAEVQSALLEIQDSQNSHKLTQREKQVVEMLRARPPLANKEIADRLNVSERTVKFHVSSLLLKYGFRSRYEF